jgi:hypothetical protein
MVLYGQCRVFHSSFINTVFNSQHPKSFYSYFNLHYSHVNNSVHDFGIRQYFYETLDACLYVEISHVNTLVFALNIISTILTRNAKEYYSRTPTGERVLSVAPLSDICLPGLRHFLFFFLSLSLSLSVPPPLSPSHSPLL